MSVAKHLDQREVSEGGRSPGRPAPAAAQTADDSFLISAPAISLPKGGGAIRGMGEKFAANPVTGSGSFSIPLPLSPGRSGFGPQLALAYDSGSGNGPFGFGWSLGLPSITRKTDKGLPQYNDVAESDVFILSGAEDLVPVLNDDGTRFVAAHSGYTIHRYRPRIEGLFARIERWARDDGDIHWRSISRDNILTLYGLDASSRICDPKNPRRIFSWLISETRDDKGNAVIYEYKPEDGDNVNLSQAHEHHRGDRQDSSRTANRYLKRIRYANCNTLLTPEAARPLFLDNDAIDDADWKFEVVFDYGDQEVDDFTARQWQCRTDPFSSYRSGFEVRTYRLCRRVLMFHHFDGFDPDYPVRVLELMYRNTPQAPDSSDPGYSFLASAMIRSYQRDNQGVLHSRQMPPVEFAYSEARISKAVAEIDPDSLANLPVGLGGGYQWVDLDGEGVAGILTEQAGAWHYKPGLGDGRFGPMRTVAQRPAIAALSAGRQQLMDLQGNGALALVDFHPPLAGYHERDDVEGWKRFIPFANLPNVDWGDPNLRYVDLTGDGHADALITEYEVFTWYPSRAEKGFGAAERVLAALNESEGPRIVFADGEQAIYLADMSGDGLTDLVRIRNGELCYWPNLGYGRFGKQVIMDNAPWFTHADLFDQRRIRLVDIDGSGTTDLIYLGRDGARLWFNRSGNGWDAPRQLPFPVATGNVGQIQVADLLGNGTACLVWSSDLPGDSRRPLRYLDLMGGNKPHLMTGMRNNLGAETRVQYAPSTRFYLRDKAAGTPWVTRLSFPVHCVEKVTVIDRHRKTEFTTAYSYHHGYFDGVEREFRGFGRVEQVDLECFEVSNNVTSDHALYQPPVKSITWFHTGLAEDRDRILGLYEHEYFSARHADRFPPRGFAERALPQPVIDPGKGSALDADEWREAMRACKGMVLRQEVYELDFDALKQGEHKTVRLFTAAHRNCHIRRLQPRGANKHAVFLATESEALTYHYELDLTSAAVPTDPRVAHTLNLRFDDYGRPLQSVAAVYRRVGEHDDTAIDADQLVLIRKVQREQHLVCTETRFTEALPDNIDVHRLPVPCEVRTYELTGLDPGADRYFSLDALRQYRLSDTLDPQAPEPVAEIPYQQQPDNTPRKRCVEHVVTLYFKDDLSGPLDFGKPSRLGLTYETYKLALTQSLLTEILRTRFDAEAKAALNMMGAKPDFFASGYQAGDKLFAPAPSEPQWWMRSGVAGFSSDAPRHFCLPDRYTDPFGNVTALAYGTDYLYVSASTDALGNTSTVLDFDRRVLAPSRMQDANGNVSEVAFDIHGLPVAVAQLGKLTAGQPESGDSVSGLDFDLLNPSPAEVAQFFETQSIDGRQARRWLGKSTARFLYHFGEAVAGNGGITWGITAAGACSILREKHEADQPNHDDPDPGKWIPVQMAFEYSDGGGQVLVKKVQAEPDPADAAQVLRWIANGKTILNNKGKPVKQYEAYFSEGGHVFEEPREVGVTPVLYYDAPGRLIRTEFPDGTLSRVEFTPWSTKTWDQNDTVLESDWYQTRNVLEAQAPLSVGPDGLINADPGQRAGWLAARHADTPAQTHLDSLGREVIAIAHNRVQDPNGRYTFGGTKWKDEFYLTYTRLDAEGKPLWIRDALGHLVMQYITPARVSNAPGNDVPPDVKPCYDIAGNLLYQHSMDAGDRWMIADAAGKPLLAWDFNERKDDAGNTVPEERRFRTGYDALCRPTGQWLHINGAEAQVEVFEYCDTSRPNGATDLADARARNLIGQAVRHWDPSGLATVERIDLSGQPARITRTLVKDVTTAVVNWDVADGQSLLEAESFVQFTEHDALGRVATLYNWHRETAPGQSDRIAVYVPGYNERGVLKSEWLHVRATKATTAGKVSFTADPIRSKQSIVNVTYNEKGQKLTLMLGNGTTTRYSYDDKTYRLVHLYTRRGPGHAGDCAGDPDAARPARPCGVQNLHYTYDPVGNITHIHDDARQTIHFNGQLAEPSNDYTYDALYRLTEATGRENAAAVGAPPQPDGPWSVGTFPSPGVTRRYKQRYVYDSVGNITTMAHEAHNFPGQPDGSWKRDYQYAFDDFTHQPASNRLWKTTVGADTVTYRHDPHGNMLNLSDAAPGTDMRWDWRDMIRALDLQGGGWAYYNYGIDKQRTRKRLARNGGTTEDRIYLGGYELYRRKNPLGEVVEEIESHHLFEGEQRVLLVDDVLLAKATEQPGPNKLSVKEQTLWRYQYGNHLGSVGLELDDTARIISYEEFHPYGSSAYRLMNRAIEAPAKRYRYTGMERDEESGLSYHTARYYLPSLGRWLTPDPMPPKGRLNLYEYASALPNKRADTNGNADVPASWTNLTLDHEISQDTAINELKDESLLVDADNLRLFVSKDNFGKGNKKFRVPPIKEKVSLTQLNPLEILERRLSEVAELDELWQRASDSERNTYATSRTKFYELLRTDQSEAAKAFREAWSTLGDFDPETGLPRLRWSADFEKLLGSVADSKVLTQRQASRFSAWWRSAERIQGTVDLMTESLDQMSKRLNIFETAKEVGRGFKNWMGVSGPAALKFLSAVVTVIGAQNATDQYRRATGDYGPPMGMFAIMVIAGVVDDALIGLGGAATGGAHVPVLLDIWEREGCGPTQAGLRDFFIRSQRWFDSL